MTKLITLRLKQVPMSVTDSSSLPMRHSAYWPRSRRKGSHPRLKHAALASLRVFRVSGFEKILLLYLPRRDGVEILRVVHGSRNLQALLRREGLK
jgi:hypothetical protein